MLKNTLGLSFGLATILLTGVSVFLPSCGGTGESSGFCTEGKTESCACSGGKEGVQTCNSDGKFGSCDCSSGNGGSGAGTNTGNNGGNGGGMTQSGLCGNGVPDPGECGFGTEFPCPEDCMGTGGMGGGTTTTSTSTITEDPCKGHITFAGLSDGTAPSAWGAHKDANSNTGYAAGISICQAAVGADHPCDYEELLAAETAGELATIPMGTSIWIHRITTAMVGGNPSMPGPGGRCNDWTYTTNHISDGEFATFNMVGTPTYTLDNDTFFDGVDTTHAQPGALQCNGEMRHIPCCFPACE